PSHDDDRESDKPAEAAEQEDQISPSGLGRGEKDRSHEGHEPHKAEQEVAREDTAEGPTIWAGRSAHAPEICSCVTLGLGLTLSTPLELLARADLPVREHA